MYKKSIVAIFAIKLILVTSIIVSSCNKESVNQVPQLSENQVQSIHDFQNFTSNFADENLKLSESRRLKSLSEDSVKILNEKYDSIFQPLQDESFKLLEVLGLDSNEMKLILKGKDENVVLVAAFAVAIQNSVENNNVTASNSFVNVLGSCYAAQSGGGYSFAKEGFTAKQTLTCAVEALGIPATYILGATGGQLTTAALKRVATKLAAKSALGAIGVAYTLYEFSSCMDFFGLLD